MSGWRNVTTGLAINQTLRNLIPLYKWCFKPCRTLHVFLQRESPKKNMIIVKALGFKGHQTGRGTWHYKANERELTFPGF